MTKLKAVVLYGGRSTEHEISCRSASYIFANIDRQLYDVYAIAIDKQGVWRPQNRHRLEQQVPEVMPLGSGEDADRASHELVQQIVTPGGNKEGIVIFNILHGTYGEDGSMQGFLDMQGIAYVGPGTLGSALAMDKVVAKQLVSLAGVPVVPYVAFRADAWANSSTGILKEITEKLRFPLFIKPASLGSSVGIRKVTEQRDLEGAIKYALGYDERILVEIGLDVREIEYACLGGYEPKVSAAGEIGVPDGFYSYEEKYASTSRASVQVPARLEARVAAAGQELAKKIFRALNLYGLARIDLFLTRDEGNFYFNEANTLPGFTSISQYPKLWDHSGYSAKQLVSELLELAVQRRHQNAHLKRSI